MNNNLFFSCPFGGLHGWGHVVRCSALAEQARERGFTTHICSPSDFSTLPAEIRDAFSQIVSCASTSDYDAVIVDNPEMGQHEVMAYSLSKDALIVVIDDECTRNLSFADIIVNPAIDAHTLPYPETVNIKCLGETYALLRSPLEMPSPNDASRSGIALVMGGTDVLNLVPKILSILMDSESPFSQTSIQLITPPRPETQRSIESCLHQSKQLTWLQKANADQIAHIFQTSQFGITACGGTAYEMACCGLPFVGIVVAENQKQFARSIHKRWQLPVIDGQSISSLLLLNRLQSLANTSNHYAQVDGHGASRVLDRIIAANR